MRLSKNTILITGGTAGIGLELARRFVELDNTVIVTGRSADKIETAKREVPGIHAIQSDVSDVDAIKALAGKVADEHSTLNVLINNAGVFRYLNVSSPTDDLAGLTSELDINVAGPIRMVSAFIGRLKQNNGTIINVSSGLAFVPLQAAPVYCATKAALHSYTQSLRQQLKGSSVKVIELMPPAVRTDLTADLPDDAGFKIITTDELMHATFKGLRKGLEEIRPGQANQLRMMSRIAPGFIGRQLEKGSAPMVPRV